MRRTSFFVLAGVIAAAVLSTRPAFAGPPLVCFPFDIGQARSLPILQTGYGAVDPKYDVAHLVTDTLELLTPKAPVIVHMETIRRAALYAKANPYAGAALLSAVQARAETRSVDAPLAVFDFGYLVETYRQAGAQVGADVDGYVWVQKAIALDGNPQMEFAAAIMSGWPRRPNHAAHVRTAEAAARNDELLNRNLAGHIQESQP